MIKPHMTMLFQVQLGSYSKIIFIRNQIYSPFLTQCMESLVVCLNALTHGIDVFVIALVHAQKVYFLINSID